MNYNLSDKVNEFLSINQELIEILPIAVYKIKECFPYGSISFEILSEINDWETLFIVIKVKSNWCILNDFMNYFQE